MTFSSAGFPRDALAILFFALVAGVVAAAVIACAQSWKDKP